MSQQSQSSQPVAVAIKYTLSHRLLLLLPLLIVLRPVHGARILALTTTPSHSHHIWNHALLRALTARGHHVTSIGPDQEDAGDPNHAHIVIDGAYEFIAANFNYETRREQGLLASLLTQFRWGTETCAHGLGSRGSRGLTHSNRSFDLIIVEVVFAECFLGFVDRFGYPPVLGITAFGTPPWASLLTGSPEIPSFQPHYALEYSDRMSFSERLVNLLVHVFAGWYRRFVYLPRMDGIAQTHFGQSLPPVSEIEKNIELVMVNSHFSWDYPRPATSAMIQVGGLHIKPAKRLPDDLQTYLNEANEGVIFFSLGSNVKCNTLSEDKIAALLDAFRVLPFRALWKWESDVLKDKPTNVKISKWLPQSDILGHPNVRLFITHSGLLSTHEALYHGVPLVGIPFFADQHSNIHRAVTHGVGVRLDFGTLSKESVLAAVNTVLNNASYKDNMQRLSKIFRDQPESPLDRAVFWTEFLLRRARGRHRRAGGYNQNLLLVYAGAECFSLVLVTLLLFTVLGVLVLVFRKTRRS